MSLTVLLNNLAATVQSASVVCTSSKRKTEVLASVSNALAETNKVHEILATNKKKLLPVRRSVVILSNTLSGIVDGLESGELAPTLLRKIGTSLSTTVVPALTAAVEANLGSIDRFAESPSEEWTHTTVSATEYDDNPDYDDSKFLTKEERNQTLAEKDAVKKAQRDIHYKESEEKAVKDIEALTRQQKSLPSKISGPYNLVTYPVVPILDVFGSTLRESLTRRGFSIHSLGSYMVFAGQRLIAIDTVAVKEYDVPSVDAYVQHVLDAINKTASTKYVLMSEKHRANPKNPKIWLYWIVPKNRLFDRFRPGSVKDWDLLKEVDDLVHQDNMYRIEEQKKDSIALVEERAKVLKEETERMRKERDQRQVKLLVGAKKPKTFR